MRMRVLLWAHFDNYGVDAVCEHALEQMRLRHPPQRGKTRESKPATHIFNTQTLVI
jgi:hypothetical protein